MIVQTVAFLSLAIWIYLLVGHGGFWRAGERDDAVLPDPETWPELAVIVPARDEADVIGQSIGSLLAQDYPGRLSVYLVDDGSSDDTPWIARAAAETAGAKRLSVIAGAPLPRGWTGKLWAVNQGIEAAGEAPVYLWLTDADIVHAPDTARSLVARAEKDGLVLNSLMADLRCESPAERALIPAFIFFFMKLYPFARVNRSASPVAGAAGGCVLLRRKAFARMGGVGAIKHAIIDDCALGALMKKSGAIRVQLTRRSRSIRPYGGWRPIGAMVSRSAYAQLGYSPLLLLGTLIGMGVIYLAPPLITLFGAEPGRFAAAAAWIAMAIAYQPTLRFYGRSPLWGVALPLIAGFYVVATLMSAVHYWQGRGGMWKGRAQARAGA